MARKPLLVALAASIAFDAPAHADPTASHEVVYTVITQSPATVDIYYRDADPPTWADYSHNPYEFSPKVRVDVDPGSPWVLHASLVDPQRWAMVTATSDRSSVEPGFRCELTVDGAVVTTAEGPKGALCALRHW